MEYFHWIFEFLKHEVDNKDKIIKIKKTKNKCFDVLCNLVVMKVKCRGCDKTFLTKTNRNKHQQAAGLGPSEMERGEYHMIQRMTFICTLQQIV